MEKPLKNKIVIVRIIARLNIGGPAIHTILLTEGLNKQLFETYLVVGKPDVCEGDLYSLAKEKKLNIKYIAEFGREIGILDFVAFLKLFIFLKKVKPDIVHTHTAKAGTLGRLAAILSGVPIKIHTFHGHVFHDYFSPIKTKFFVLIEKLLAYFTSIIVTISESQLYEICDVYKIAPRKKFRVIKLGFDLELFYKANIKGKIRNELSITEKTLLIGIIGRLVEIKDHKFFLNVAKILIKDFKSGEIKFLIVGDGKLRKPLEDYSAEMGIKDDVIFLGWRKDLNAIYADLDVVALTSLNEGTPLSLIEAFASGKPVVSTDVGGVRDIVSDNKSGFLVKKRDPKEFADKISILIKDSNLREEMGKRGKEFVRVNYSKERLIKDMEDLYLRFYV